jgi:translocator protein
VARSAETVARRSWILPAGWLAVVLVYAGLSRLWTDTESAWYQSLTEPPWQPPDVVFGIIWPLNFLALAVVGVLVSRSRPDVSRRMLAVFAVSVVFALGWSYLFSQERALLGSAVSLVVAAALTWVLLAIASRAGRAYPAALVVYAVWMTLAASLSVGFVVLN